MSQPDVGWNVRFGKQFQDCQFNRLRTSEKRGRSLELSPYHEQLKRRRREQAVAAFAKGNARPRSD